MRRQIARKALRDARSCWLLVKPRSESETAQVSRCSLRPVLNARTRPEDFSCGVCAVKRPRFQWLRRSTAVMAAFCHTARVSRRRDSTLKAVGAALMLERVFSIGRERYGESVCACGKEIDDLCRQGRLLGHCQCTLMQRQSTHQLVAICVACQARRTDLSDQKWR